ncbi:hypothetical protein [Paenibacillus sp. N3.4]|uniref:hypothetical protein n=1 Tax=Paenibacillus sp. N3.4 TaxID=2603222 RepID=UPI00164F8D8C|nr:hypothetical protein [Paenibacillus sp. N3.4]
MFILIVSILIFTGCTTEESYKTPEQAFVATGIKSKGIIKKVQLTDGEVIFYEGLNNDVGVGLARNYKGNWKWISGHGMEASSSFPVTFSWANLEQMKKAGKGYHIFWGSVNDEKINKLHITYDNEWNLNEDALFFDSGLGFRIWYVVSTYYYGTVPGIKATGYDKDDQIVYEN